MVDENKIALRPAVEISFLSDQEQYDLLEIMEGELATPSLAQAIRLKEFSKNGRLNSDVIFAIMSEEKPNQKETYSFKAETLRRYLPENISREQTEEYVLKALDYYQRYLQRQKGQER